jgi:hypothetical protein
MHTSSSETGRVYVSAYSSDGTALFTNATDTVDVSRTDIFGSGTIYIRVTPQSGYPGSYTVQFDGAVFSPSALTTSFVQYTLSTAAQVDWYSFNAVSASTYTIKWEDYGTNGTTGDIYVSVYKADGTSFFVNKDATPGTAITGYTGAVYVRVTPYYTNGTWLGTYNILYEAAP